MTTTSVCPIFLPFLSLFWSSNCNDRADGSFGRLKQRFFTTLNVKGDQKEIYSKHNNPHWPGLAKRQNTNQLLEKKEEYFSKQKMKGYSFLFDLSNWNFGCFQAKKRSSKSFKKFFYSVKVWKIKWMFSILNLTHLSWQK